MGQIPVSRINLRNFHELTIPNITESHNAVIGMVLVTCSLYTGTTIPTALLVLGNTIFIVAVSECTV